MPTTPSTVSDLFPREHLLPADLRGPVVVTIASWELREFHIGPGQDETKPILRFEKAKRFLILNKTNALTIARALGSEKLDDWIGQQVQLRPDFARGRACIVASAAPKPAGNGHGPIEPPPQ